MWFQTKNQLYGIFILLCQTFSMPYILHRYLISYKMWCHDDITTALLQNQIIVIVFPIYLKCRNKVWHLVEWGFYLQERLMSCEKKEKKQTLLVSCLPIVVVEQHYHNPPPPSPPKKSTSVLFFFHRFFGFNEGKG